MRSILSAAMTLCLMSARSPYTLAQAAAQTPPAPRRAGAAVPAQTMDLESAKKIAAGAEAAAIAANQHVAICVMDTNGDPVVVERINGTGRGIVSAAQGKARAVLLFGMATGPISDASRDKKPVTATITPLALGAGGEVVLLRGGLPIMKDEKMIGAIGVGGSASETDEKFAQAGLDAFNAK